ncbi:hypothetical protein PLESTB_000704000 [Pleodorina starrii]|uniref:DUF1664 domain-containing protein n=1 Tax=Pleodorina starrii TaxID=330485 RepID=A0A9W6BJ35_9CHLO|nr:hypothetical protein PLESTM_001212600 [Pleodorina starrii]GLC53064.1 hypothetical protein PLESTB_000704000 [Pleodorina starrii]GLC74990.1 hypothetical protein PLESTF_001581200 [Pleodorina starrii]
MPSWPTALGGMFLTGYAATQAHKVGIDSPTSLVATALKTLNNENLPSSSGRSSNTELTVLQGEVDRLHKLLSDVVRDRGNNSGYTVIHTGRGGWSVYIIPAAVVGGVVYLYVKIRGVAVSDFFMVTNRSLQQFRDLVSSSMTQLWEELRKQKDEFIKRISTVGEQQQAMMAQQSAMDTKLRDVSSKVEEIRDISDSIESRVGQMDHNINMMSSAVNRANEGIFLLCSAVAEVTRRVGMDNSRLKSYVQAAPPEIANNPGLRTLLAGFGSGEQPALPAAVLSASSSISGGGGGGGGGSVTGVITEVSEVVEGCGGGGGGEGALAALGVSAARQGSEIGVMYRRNSLASVPSLRSTGSMLGSLWSSSSANFAGAGSSNGGRSSAGVNGI